MAKADKVRLRKTSLEGKDGPEKKHTGVAKWQLFGVPVWRVLAPLLASVFFTSAYLLWYGTVVWSTDGRPRVYRFRVVQRYPHDPRAFTQGLLWLNGSLYESTGLYGRSGVREVRLKDGKTLREVRCLDKEFGEGLVHKNGELLQLLWRVGDGVRYTAQAGKGGHLARKRDGFKTPLSDGWGLETYNEFLLATDSGPDIFFLDSEDFTLKRTMRVFDQGRPIEMLNEMEMIHGEIWANVFGADCIAQISPNTGNVVGWVVFDGLLNRHQAAQEAASANRDPPDVFNGIAWDSETDRIFVTGKLWPSLFEVEIIPAPEMDLEHARELCIPKGNIFRR